MAIVTLVQLKIRVEVIQEFLQWINAIIMFMPEVQI